MHLLGVEFRLVKPRVGGESDLGVQLRLHRLASLPEGAVKGRRLFGVTPFGGGSERLVIFEFVLESTREGQVVCGEFRRDDKVLTQLCCRVLL